jgi:hypothetical protein
VDCIHRAGFREHGCIHASKQHRHSSERFHCFNRCLTNLHDLTSIAAKFVRSVQRLIRPFQNGFGLISSPEDSVSPTLTVKRIALACATTWPRPFGSIPIIKTTNRIASRMPPAIVAAARTNCEVRGVPDHCCSPFERAGAQPVSQSPAPGHCRCK